MQEHQHPRNREPVQRVLGRAFTSFRVWGVGEGGGFSSFWGFGLRLNEALHRRSSVRWPSPKHFTPNKPQNFGQSVVTIRVARGWRGPSTVCGNVWGKDG